ncbi:MAG: LemA family protein [Candidatus Nanoarchaeia archaeon]|nr:LemA family protein [Candidatus Nanoarchaeia archaeon]
MLYLWIIAAIAIMFYLINIYNKFIFLEKNAKNAWIQIDINIKLRNDLLPLLVNIVKGYSNYEKNTLKELTELRLDFINSKNISNKILINEKINNSIKLFFANAEKYPELAANKSFLKLQSEISKLESNIAFKRQFYNDTVNKFNNFLMSFPSNIVGKMLGFESLESFSYNSEYKKVKL